MTSYKSVRRTRSQNNFSSFFVIIFAGAIAILTASCTLSEFDNDSYQLQDFASSSSATSSNAIARAQYWRKKYEKNPNNPAVAIGFGKSLYEIGSVEKAENVFARALARYPNDIELILAYSKILTRTGKLKQAAHLLKKAHATMPPNWRVYLARGIVFDNMRSHQNAQIMYTKALSLNPYEPKIINNLGMSHLLAGDLKAAEVIFQKALEMQYENIESKSKVRQNLALTIGLLGRFEESEKIISSELSPKEARENIEYIRQLVGNKANWKSLGNVDNNTIE